jgi:hypothetical protein
MSEAFQVELREFIRRLNLEDSKLHLMRQQASELREGIRNLYADGLTGGGFCLTTISGKILGAYGATIGTSAILVPRSSVQFIGSVTGTNYGTFFTSDGNFSVTFAGLHTATEGGVLNAFVTGPGARFQASAPQTVSFTECSTITGVNLVATPATGYQWTNNQIGRGCVFPIKNTLSFVDSSAGIGSGTVSGTTNWLSACQQANTTAQAGCPSVNTSMKVSLIAALDAGYFFQLGVGGCPAARTCATATFGGQGQGASRTVLSKTDPDETTLFDMTLQFTDENKFHGPVPSTNTLRFFETP